MSRKVVLKNRLGELMAEYSRKRGRRLTQTELSSRTGIAQSTISNIINNKITLYDVNTVSRLLDFFGVSSNEFFLTEVEDAETERLPAQAG